jgi:hypothetical protein
MLQNDDDEYDGDLAEGQEQWLPSATRRKRRWPVALAAIAVLIGAIWVWNGLHLPQTGPSGPPVAFVTPPPPLPESLDQRLRALTPEQAVVANAEIEQSKEPIEPAGAFVVPLTEAMAFSRTSAIDCMTAAVFYEAASESEQGQRAVAQVILNRVRHPAYPNSVCGVVFQGSERKTGCQFSFTCDGSLARKPSQAAWDRARRIAEMSLTGAIEPSVGMATHYHTIWILPYWAPSLDKVTTVGAHIFYRWKGYWGKRAAFVGTYSGETSDPALGAFPTDAALGPTDGLLLGTGQFDAGGSLTGAAGLGPAPLLQDHGGAQLKAESSSAQIRADEGSQRPAADDANGVLIGPGSGGPAGH